MNKTLSFLTLLIIALPGCAAITNPVANGIPVRLLPPELLAESQEALEPTPLQWLRQEPPEIYRLAPNDILGVYIEGVLGERDQLPPINFPEGDLPPSLGFPIPVREDGTVPLPLIPPVNVTGMSITEAERAIVRAYTVDRQILQPDRERIIVTLMRRRTVRVLVVRQDSPQQTTTNANFSRNIFRGGNFGLSRGETAGTGQVLELPAYENDVLNALTLTGGLPGLNAENEVRILRGAYTGQDAAGLNLQDETRTTRIRARLRLDEPPPFKPEDIILQSGDIVFVPARDTEFYHTGGLLPAAEIPLPRDFDLDVVEAITRIGGPLINGGINSNNLSGSIVQSGLGNPSPSNLTVIRRLEDGRQVPIRVDLNRALTDPRENILVQAGDILILQETPGEAFTRYANSVIDFQFFSELFTTPDAFGTVNAFGP